MEEYFGQTPGVLFALALIDAFSIAATTATLIAAVGALVPASPALLRLV